MESVLLIIHLFLALAIIGFVLLQRSEGGGLGIGGGGGGAGSLAGAKSTANFLTKATTYCAVAFFCTSLALGVIAKNKSNAGGGILDELDEPVAPVSAPMLDENQADSTDNDNIDVTAPAPSEEDANEADSDIPVVPIE